MPSLADLTSLLSYEWIEIETVACLVSFYDKKIGRKFEASARPQDDDSISFTTDAPRRFLGRGFGFLAGVGLGCHFEEQGSASQNCGVVDRVAGE
jgi:hypothetical protein